MKNIYGNKYLLGTLSDMHRTGKTPHTVLFFGEKGSGRKLMAQYYTQLLLCENPVSNRPCGICRSCTNIEKGLHPDVIYAQTSGKLGGYSVAEAKSICSDAFVKPNNNSGKKIYIFRDCHDMDIRTQNTLLKIIEEPPDYAYFIFTSESKNDFLPTIISRCICLGVSSCTEEEAVSALSECGYNQEEISPAVSCFHGNIGMCISYITDENIRRLVDLTKSLADSIIRKDEYMLNVYAFSAGKERNDIRTILYMLELIMRDSAVISQDRNAEADGISRDTAVKLSDMLTFRQTSEIHRCIEKAWKSVECNIGIPLALSALCAEISGIIEK